MVYAVLHQPGAFILLGPIRQGIQIVLEISLPVPVYCCFFQGLSSISIRYVMECGVDCLSAPVVPVNLMIQTELVLSGVRFPALIFSLLGIGKVTLELLRIILIRHGIHAVVDLIFCNLGNAEISYTHHQDQHQHDPGTYLFQYFNILVLYQSEKLTQFAHPRSPVSWQ